MPNTRTSDQILIAGAGIGGLSTAIALARKGIPSLVLERSKEHSTDGAGIQLGPNATRILDEWGVLDRLSESAVISDGITIGDGLTGEILASVPFGETALQRYGAPFLLVHRGDLHRALVESARDHSIVDITTDCEVLAYKQIPDEIILTTTKGELRGRALIVADGLWSKLRPQIDAGAKLEFTGKTAWRTLIDPQDLPEQLRGPRTALWLSKTVHLVHYPVCGGKKINVVSVINERWGGRAQGWNQEADPQALLPYFEPWYDRIADIVKSGSSWRKWSLFYQPPLRAWTQGSVTMIGDAAHPVLPFLAQGGGLAIEDAAVLVKVLVDHDGDPWRAFRHFEKARIERTARTSYESRKMGRIYHMGGVMRLARNFVLRRQSPNSLLKRLDWLYQYRVDNGT
ncbi:MAG: FAD-dependent monooxygenase [Alphaproteobacteria bacterium]